MCVDNLDTFEKNCPGGTTTGFTGELKIAYEEEVISLTEPDPSVLDHTVTVDLGMRVAAAGPPVIEAGTFKTFPISIVPGKNKIETTVEGDADSSIYKHAGEFFIAGVTGKKSSVLSNTKGRRFVFLLEDKDGNIQIVGKPKDGASVMVEEINSDGRGYRLKVDWSSKGLLYFYTGAVVE